MHTEAIAYEVAGDRYVGYLAVDTDSEALVAINTAKAADANKARATKPLQLPAPPPLKPVPPPAAH